MPLGSRKKHYAVKRKNVKLAWLSVAQYVGNKLSVSQDPLQVVEVGLPKAFCDMDSFPFSFRLMNFFYTKSSLYI